LTFRYRTANPNWNDAFEEATTEWNAVTPFTFRIVRNSFADPCRPPGLIRKNGANFTSKACGDDWGTGTLAIAFWWTTIDGNTMRKTGIIFNSNESWDVYSGPIRAATSDFRRVAVHELGHALGLGHENSIPAIMASFIENIEVPQQDDIDGVNFLYPQPDLAVTLISVGDSTLTPGQSFMINATVKNIDAGSSDNTTLRYFRSTDDIISTSDTPIGTDPVSALPPNATSPESLDTAAPTVAGTFWVGACVDAVDRESNTDNNCSTGVQISVFDTDGDGVADGDDNCPAVANDQTNTDGDAEGDACDPDDDNDGMPDAFETTNALDPLNPADASGDLDGDGFTNLQEFLVGTDPDDPKSNTATILLPILQMLFD
jgi:hypothetical protein